METEGNEDSPAGANSKRTLGDVGVRVESIQRKDEAPGAFVGLADRITIVPNDTIGQ